MAAILSVREKRSMSDLYHLFSVNPTYPLDRILEGTKELADAISDFKKLHPTIEIYQHKVKLA